MSRLVRQSVAACGVSTQGPWVVQRGGQTNRVWHLQDQGLIVKLYLAVDNPLFANDPSAEAECLSRLSSQGLAPELIAQGECADGRWIVYRHIDGDPWNSEPAPVAQILRRVHAQPLPDLASAPDTDESLRSVTESLIRRLSGAAAQHLRRLEPAPPADHPPPRRTLLHGDPVPGNILIDGSNATLIDWQCPGIGDPAHDLALFLSPGMQQVYRGAPLTAAERATTLAAYDCAVTSARLTALQPSYHWLIAAYCTWKSERGAPHYRAAAEVECAALS